MTGLIFTGPARELIPQQPNICIYPEFCVNGPTTLIIKEKAFTWSGDDFQVKDQNGVPVVVCKGQFMSFRGRKIITNPQGQVMFHLVDKFFSWRKTYIAEDDNQREIFRVVKKMAFRTKMEATFINSATGKPVTLYLVGDFWGGSADLTLGETGPPIAQITRHLWNAREIFTNNQTYYVNVAAGVDLALIAGICIAFDEAVNDGK